MSFSIDKQFYKKLVGIALPISLQSLISASLTLLDNLMVSSLGELSLTSVGLATQSFTIEWMMIFGLCSGCATFYTQLWGIKDTARIRKVIGINIVSSLIAASLFFIAGFFFPVSVMSLFTNSPQVAELGAVYLKIASVNFLLIAITQPFSAALRATQQTKIPMYISIASFITDALFNYLLIFGQFGFPKLGVAGAAIATVLARILELLITIYIIFIRKNVIAGRIADFFSFDARFAKRVLTNASVTTLNETMWSGSVVATNAAYGHLGVTAYAAMQACITITDMFQMACFSIGDASMILIGEQLGQNNLEEAKAISAKLLKCAWIISGIMAALVIALNRPIIGLFSLTTLGVFYARRIIIIKALTIPLNLQCGILISGTFRAGGDARYAAIMEISIMWLYAVPMAFIGALVWKLPIYWVVILVSLEQILKVSLLYNRYRSGKWIKNMISGM